MSQGHEHTFRETGTPKEEPPAATPVCPSCGAVGVYTEKTVSRLGTYDVIVWWWTTMHDPGCTWMADPDAEPY
jgi:hypothetical protein